MFRLTREVRFAVNPAPDPQLGSAAHPSNSYAGFPSLTGLGHHFALQVTLAGPLDERSQYLRNIKEIDRAVRERAVPAVTERVTSARPTGGADLALLLFERLADAWPGATLDTIRLSLSPFLAYTALAREHPMVRLSQRFEFSATHRLHNPTLSDDQNRETFGKCNNPLGHGHNYEVQVTLCGTPDANGLVIDVPRFERIVKSTVIDRFDHRNLNLELPEFRERIPSVENIAMTIHQLLKPPFAETGVKLATVTVWETPKTWCEYAE